MDGDALAHPIRRWLPRDRDGDGVNRLLHVDARLSLADDLLIVADHMSMAASVELRVPFLDLEFMALVERMPSRYKVSMWKGRKWLYRRAVADLLPPSIRRDLVGVRARMGRKHGFTTPLDWWLGPWVDREAEGFFLGPGAVLPDHVRVEGIRALLDAARRGAPRTRQIFTLLALESWLRAATGAPSPST